MFGLSITMSESSQTLTGSIRRDIFSEILIVDLFLESEAI
jgi:hypothetical protein